MYKVFLVVGVLLILLGVALFAMPVDMQAKREAMRRSAPPQPVGIVEQVIALAERYNAPISIMFGGISLYYSRKRYLTERDRKDARRA